MKPEKLSSSATSLPAFSDATHTLSTSATGAGVAVAVIDSGWDRSLRDCRVVPGIGLVDPADDLHLLESTDDSDRIGHGTACTHLILEIAPGVAIIPVRVFGNRLETSPEMVELGILRAVERGAHIATLSLATWREDAGPVLYRACKRAADAGVVVIAAAPDHRALPYPSAFDVAIGVGMGDWSDPFEFSYQAGDVVECRSPGRSRKTSSLGGKQVWVTGASFAVPNIAGLAALWLERTPSLGLCGIRGRLAQFATR
jgi:subtilisin